MEQEKILRGAEIVIRNWIGLRPSDKLCLVSSELHRDEILALEKAARRISDQVRVMLVEQEGLHVGDYFDARPEIFFPYDVVIAATDYSIVTTRACDAAIKKGVKFLSLPLSTTNGESLLSFDFLMMDTELSRLKAQILRRHVDHSSLIHVESQLGTMLDFSMEGRKAGFFNGTFKDNHSFASASFELYIPIVENKTCGTLVCDGAFGYIGRAEEPVTLKLQEGRIVSFSENPEGERLKAYFASYRDERMYVAGEFGIGLNSLSRCRGLCYIEDESSYGTFHIGFGRNIGLGGCHEANGHFDLTTLRPSIWFDHHLIMREGELLLPELEIRY